MAFNLPKYELRQGRVNKGHPGILLISEKYEFLYNKANKEQSIFYYYCKFRRTKGIVCPAKASLVKNEGEDEETRFLLLTWPEEHTHRVRLTLKFKDFFFFFFFHHKGG